MFSKCCNLLPTVARCLENPRWGCCLKFELSDLGDLFGGAGGHFGGPPAPKQPHVLRLFLKFLNIFAKKTQNF